METETEGKRGNISVRFAFGVLSEGGMGGIGLNAEQAPYIGKCIGEW